MFPLIHGTAVLDTIVWEGPASEEEHQRGYLEPLPEGSRRLTVIEAATGTPIGVLSIRRGEPPERGDLGFWIGIPHQGRGYGTAAVARSLEIAFGEMGMEKVEACVFVGNDASVRILEKNGFRHEGLIRKGTLKRGRWIDEHLLGITREDWEGGPGLA